MKINGTYSNNIIVRAANGYSITTTVVYSITDRYEWGNKESTPLPLGAIVRPEGKNVPLLSWVQSVQIPHEWEVSLRTNGYTNEFDYTVTWFEKLQIQINEEFTNFSLSTDNIYNVNFLE